MSTIKLNDNVAELDLIMGALPIDVRYRWCSSKSCGCLGAANCSSDLVTAGYNKLDWYRWVSNNPNPNNTGEQ